MTGRVREPLLVLDAGALLALARGDVVARATIKRGLRQGYRMVVPTPVVAQVHRAGRDRAAMDRVLQAVDSFIELIEFADSKKKETGVSGSELRAEAVQYVAISLAEIWAGGFLAPMGLGAAIAAIVFGHVLGNTMMVLGGVVGSDHGRPSLDIVECADIIQRLLRNRALVLLQQFVELTSGMRPAADLGDAGGKASLVAGVVIADQIATPVCQEVPGRLAAP